MSAASYFSSRKTPQEPPRGPPRRAPSLGSKSAALNELIRAQDVTALLNFLSASENISIADKVVNLTSKRSQTGWSPLHIAASIGGIECLMVLLQLGADPTAKDKTRRLPLHVAANFGHSSAILLLLGQDGDSEDASVVAENDPVTENDPEGASVAENDPEGESSTREPTVPEHVARACINARALGAVTPLHMATQSGHLKAVEMLLRLKADPKMANVALETPLHVAARLDTASAPELVSLLLYCKADCAAAEYKNKCAPLHYAAWFGRRDAAESMLLGKADVDVKDKWGWTPVHYAARYDHDDTVKLLLKNKASVNAQAEQSGNTALHKAAEFGCQGAVKRLLEGKANTDIPNKFGRKAMDLAILRSKKEVVELLTDPTHCK